VRDDVCLGYAVLRGGDAAENEVVVRVDEWLDDGGDGLPAVLSFLSQLHGRVSLLQIPMPPDRPLAAWLAPTRPLPAQVHLGPCLAVIDAAAVVAAALGDVPVELGPGSIQVAYPEGKLALPLPVLSALVAGSLDAATAKLQGDLTGPEASCHRFVEQWPQSRSFRFPRAGGRHR
jgi:hypothetical protein